MASRQPTYGEVLIRPNVRVPMRDGVELVTDLYLPARDGKVAGPQPALLLRTPYNKGASNSPQAMDWARHGYVVAIQDVRGRYASEGVFTAFAQEGQDGYDCIEWLAGLPECDGRVGTWGGSYCAADQAAAGDAAPHRPQRPGHPADPVHRPPARPLRRSQPTRRDHHERSRPVASPVRAARWRAARPSPHRAPTARAAHPRRPVHAPQQHRACPRHR